MGVRELVNQVIADRTACNVRAFFLQIINKLKRMECVHENVSLSLQHQWMLFLLNSPQEVSSALMIGQCSWQGRLYTKISLLPEEDELSAKIPSWGVCSSGYIES